MTSNRFLTFAAAVGSLVLVIAVVFMLWPADPTDYTLTSGRDQADGETVGWVSKVEANTIHVNSGPFGGGVVPLVVTRATRITVGSKEGWFEDIRPGGQVKVTYEVNHGKRLARSVELLVEEGLRRPVRAEPPMKSAAAGSPADRVPGPASATNPPAETQPKPAAQAPGPASPTAPSATAPATATARPTVPITRAPLVLPGGRPASELGPARAQAVETQSPGRSRIGPVRTSGTAEDGVRPQDPSQAAPLGVPGAPATSNRRTQPTGTPDGGDSTDGSAAVDWLLKNRR